MKAPPGTQILLLVAALAVLAAPRPALAELRIDTGKVDRNSEEFQRFKAYVDAAVDGRPGYGFSALDAATLYSITPKTPYCELAVRDVQAQVDEATTWIDRGGRPPVSGDSYLEAGPMIAALSLTWQVCSALISDAQRAQWSAYAEQTVWNIWHPQAAKWKERPFPWTGWSIDNPGNNYYYSFVEATMYWGLASNNETWLTLLREQKLPALSAYFGKLKGGGSLEGTGYGAAHMRLFALYRVWRDSTGTDLANANAHVDDSIRFWIHATMPTLDRFAPIGDQSRVSVPELFDYHRRLMLEARALSHDASARSQASWWLHSISVGHMSQGFNFRHDLLPAGDAGEPPAERVYHATGTGHLFARTGWDRKALWLGFNAGPYLESHAHQDQGGFTLFGSDWLAVSENIWTHSGIQQGTEVQNVLRFERKGEIIRQREPSTSTMQILRSDPASGAVEARADLTPAYAPGAGVDAWQRTIDFRERRLRVSDAFTRKAGVDAVFQVNVPVEPRIEGREAVAGRLRVKVIEPEDATLEVLDWSSLDRDEFGKGWRIDVRGGGDAFVVELSEQAP
ncbi:hypothetical protein [Dokdonella immobilis]|uniref:Heparinase II/III-like protein n=1 Tax=Dokdonella immobilis TaxID=578942 RepID=A0A1I4VGN3_9GAMM|nr:hypothetical protein [Dokdonella immobilis]SFN00325.1 hypothetical protein SAMN05216289_10268 [Dokdonella immobilis]